MDTDWASLLAAALDAGRRAAGAGSPQAEDFLREIAQAREAALKALVAAFTRGDIDESTFRSEMQDVADTLAAELRDVAVVAEAAARRAAAAFRDTLVQAVLTASRTLAL